MKVNQYVRCLSNSKGLSLLEVMVTVGIIGIISAIALPSYNRYRHNAAISSILSSMRNISNANVACKAAGGTAVSCGTLGQLGLTASNCPGCKVATSSTGDNFCAEQSRTVGAKSYRSCIQVDQDDRIVNFLVVDSTAGQADANKICHCEVTAVPDDTTTTNIDESVPALHFVQGNGVRCTANSQCDCTGVTVTNGQGNAVNSTATCGTAGSGACNSGVCS